MKAKLSLIGLLLQAGLLASSASARAATCVENSGTVCVAGQGQRLPLKIYRNFLVVAEGHIGGFPEPMNFVLDTGTAPSVINLKLAPRLGLRTTPSSIFALGIEAPVQAATLTEIDLGPIRAFSLPMNLKDLSRLENDMGIPIAGIIGMDVLSKSNFRLDYDKREIEFGDISHKGVPVHFDAHEGLAVAEVWLRGKSLRMLVDTGSQYVVLLGANFPETGWLALRNTSQSGMSFTDQRMRVQVFSAPDINVGGKHFSSEKLYFVPDGSDPVFDGLLGVRALGFRSLSYDRPRETIYLQ